MNTIKIDCPACQQPIELNQPESAPSALLGRYCREALLLLILAALSVIAWELRPKPAPMAPTAPLAPAVATPVGPTNWEYDTVYGRAVDGYSFTFWVSTNSLRPEDIRAWDRRNSEGAVELPEATVCDNLGRQGWDLVAPRAVGKDIIWIFKRPKK
jgi:hypothetical protein